MRESRWLPALGLNPPGPGTGYRNLAQKKESGGTGTGIGSSEARQGVWLPR
jgi:hypothetical protein